MGNSGNSDDVLLFGKILGMSHNPIQNKNKSHAYIRPERKLFVQTQKMVANMEKE